MARLLQEGENLRKFFSRSVRIREKKTHQIRYRDGFLNSTCQKSKFRSKRLDEIGWKFLSRSCLFTILPFLPIVASILTSALNKSHRK